MNLFGFTPIAYFNRWLAEPIDVIGEETVQSVMDALNRHQLAQDEAAQDYIMPARRYREKPGRFRIFGENQDTWYCFVYSGQEVHLDPPVYFETCLDLKLDHGFSEAEIISDHVMLCSAFSTFLWHMLGSQIGVRVERNPVFADGVHGVVFGSRFKIDESLINPLGRRYPAGYTCYFSSGVVCVQDWGAAFLDAGSGREFLGRFSPVISREWA